MADPSIAELPSFDSAPVRPSAIVAEIVVGRHRVTGELRWVGAPRRFIDVINAIEGACAFVHGAALDDPFGGNDTLRRFDVMQVHRDAILFGIPRGGQELRSSPFEAVEKVPVPAVIVLPGFEITGKVYQVPGANPTHVPQVGSRQFVPISDAVIVCSYGAAVWREPLVAVNMVQAVIYAPKLESD